MKKITLLFSAVLIFTLSFYSCEESQLDPTDPEAVDINEVTYESLLKGTDVKKLSFEVNPDYVRYCGETTETCLSAGSTGIDAGYVLVGNDDEHLYITVHSDYGFQDQEGNVKIDIVETLPSERPNAGHFPIHIRVPAGEIEVTVAIPLIELFPNDVECTPHQIYPLVHADVISSSTGATNTAWGGCEEGPKTINPNNGKETGAWWNVFDYTTSCCECWCGFGNDFGDDDSGACFTREFMDVLYKFWSNKYSFEDGKVNNTISLLVNSQSCDPQNGDGSIITNEVAIEVGTVVIRSYLGGLNGKERLFDVTYTLKEMYKDYNIQLDLYNGSTRTPDVNWNSNDIKNSTIIIDDTHKLYQHEIPSGTVTSGMIVYTFNGLPWLTDENGDDTYIAVHAAIGDCPMPSMQNPM